MFSLLLRSDDLHETVIETRILPLVGEWRSMEFTCRIRGHPFRSEIKRDFFLQRSMCLLNYLTKNKHWRLSH